MSMQIESAKNLQEFVNFANYKRDDGDAIAQFSLASGSTLRQITATDQDHIRRLGNLACHGDENAAANNQIRQHFILNVLKCLGCTGLPEDHALTQTEIKAAVNTILAGPENKTRRTALLDALKVGDYGRGRPLTSRRIGATLSQVKAVLEDRAARGGDDWSYAPGGKVVVSENIRILSSLEPEKSGLHLNPVDPAFELAIIDTMSGFLRDLTLGHNAEIFDRHGIPHGDKIQICEGLSNDRDCLELILKGDLKEVVGIVKKQWGPNVGEDALRRFLIDILKTYNRQQRFYKLRVVIPEEEIKNSNPPPSERNQITLEEPVVVNRPGMLPEKLDFQGDEDVIGGGGEREDDDVISGFVNKLKEKPANLKDVSEQPEIPVQKNASVQKSASDVKVDNPPNVREIGRQMARFMLELPERDLQGILSRHYHAPEKDTENRDSRIFAGALWIKQAFLSSAFEWSQKIVDGDLDEVVRALKKDSLKDFGDDVLRRVVRDILNAYNKRQKDENLRVVVPQE